MLDAARATAMPRDTDPALVNYSVARSSREAVEVVWAHRIHCCPVVVRVSSSVLSCHSSDPTRPAEDTTAIEWVLRYSPTEQLARGRRLVLSLEGTRERCVGEKGGRTAVKW